MSIQVVQTGQAAEVTVVASRGATGATGATGAAGPNTITTDTTSNLTGFISANGTNVSGATAGTTASTPSTVVLRDATGGTTFSGIVTAPRITGRCDGLEVFCKAGLAINAGQVVYVTGASGNNIIIGLAQANAEPTSSKTIGISESTLAHNGTGYAITEGLMTVSISAPSAIEGDPIWLSPSTAGGMVFGVANKPSAPNHIVYLGVVTRKTGNTVVEIYVKIQNGAELDELADVAISSPVEGQALMRGATLWENRSLAAADISDLGTAATTDATDYATPASVNQETAFVDQRPYLVNYRESLNAGNRPSVVVFGDSMIGTAYQQLRRTVNTELGISGYGFLDAATSSGTTTITNDCQKWITGTTYTVPTSGVVTFAVNTITAVEANQLAVYYLQTPGGGTFKIQTDRNGAGWVDEAGFTAINTDGATAGVVIQIDKTATTDVRTAWKIRVVGVSGSSVIIGAGARDSKRAGAIFTGLYNSSNGSNELLQAKDTPRAITDPIFKYLEANLVMISHYDGVTATNDYQPVVQNNIIDGTLSGNGSPFTAATNDILTVASSAASFSPMARVTTSGTLPTPLELDTDYGVEIVNATDLRLYDLSTGATVDITGTGTGTHYIKRSLAPSFISISPPKGLTDTENLQVEAMKVLAASRGDAFWDNSKWAGTAAVARQRGLILDGVHYTPKAHEQWVTQMFSDFGIAKSTSSGRTQLPEIIFQGGGRFRAYKTQYGTQFAAAECSGKLYVAYDPDTGASGGILLENRTGPTFANDQCTIASHGNSLRFTTSFNTNGFNISGGSGTGYIITDLQSTAASPKGEIGSLTIPFRSLSLGKTIVASGTTTPQTINKASGRVNLAAAETSVVVTNSLVSSSSIIIATIATDDATATSVKAIPGAGSFTILLNAATTGETSVAWMILP